MELDLGDGKRQNVHTKKESGSKEDIERRKQQSEKWEKERQEIEIERKERVKNIPYNPEIDEPVKPTSLNNLTDHAKKQARDRNVSDEAMLDAIGHPFDEKKVKFDEEGRPSIRMIGEKAEVVYNPINGNIVSVNPTHSKKARKYNREKDG